MIEALIASSILMNIIAGVAYWLLLEKARHFMRRADDKEHNRRRVANALAERFQHLAQAHKQDHDKLEPMSKVVSRQGEAIRMMQSGFHGLTTAYSKAASDVLHYMVHERDPEELLKEAAEREL